MDNVVDDVFGEFTSLNKEVQIAILLSLHIVGCVWCWYVTHSAVYATLSKACAVWFFSHEVCDGTTGPQVVLKKRFGCGMRAILSSAWCIIAKHLGSIAFGAAIMTVVKIIKYILVAIDNQTKDLQNHNFLLGVVIRCSQCCVWCLEKTIRFITYYGFIFVAIDGTGFCKACKKTMELWINYPAQVAVNEGVQWILSMCISLSIPTGAAFFGFIWIDAIGGHQPIWAALAIFILAYVIAACITDVFKCAIDTIFICAFQDMAQHQPPLYMSEALKDGFGLRDIERRLSQVKASSERGASVSQVTVRPSAVSQVTVRGPSVSQAKRISQRSPVTQSGQQLNERM